jgi:hypothetical protein
MTEQNATRPVLADVPREKSRSQKRRPGVVAIGKAAK